MRSVIVRRNKTNDYIELSAKQNYKLDRELQINVDGENVLSVDNEVISINGFALIANERLLYPAGSITLIDYSEWEYILDRRVVVSYDAFADITIEGEATSLAFDSKSITVFEGECYLNGKLIENNVSRVLKIGDALLLPRAIIVIHDKYITVYASKLVSKLSLYNNYRILPEEYPKYKRSARIVKVPKAERIKINKPENKSNSNKGSLLKTILPPLITTVATVAIGVILGRGVYMYFMVLTSIVTVTFSIINWFDSKKENKEREQKRREQYSEYLLKKRKELNEAKEQEIDALTYMNPSAEEIGELIEVNSDRLYERSESDGDFLCIRLGTASKKAEYKLDFEREAETSEDELMKEMYSICKPYEIIEDMPVIADLKNSHLAIVGDKRNTRKVLFNILAQLAFFQSYHDVEFVVLTDKEGRSEYDYLRWYPHAKIKSINIYGILDNEKVRDQVLGNLTQLMKLRREQIIEKKQNLLFLPYYIFIIDNPKLIMNHSIMEYLQQKDISLCFRMIWLSNLESNVPDNIKTMLTVSGNSKGILKIQDGVFVNKGLNLDNYDNVDYAKQARRLAAVEHIKQMSSEIPTNVGFFEMYGIKKPQDIELENLWDINDCSKSLAVPLGFKSKTDILYLNLHEKAHGPHGLIAGTTGSGKSELVQTLILSLAINFSPYEVGFLLIDYKGGGMANLFDKLPHLLGTITNLDGSENMRALTSIKAELARRQRIFSENNINSINQYTKMFRAGEVSDPLPHLFIISDEFAELKKEQPDFMRELVSTARIGRSLGVHLILATQKPGGVVDDQIWSNSKFKLALKVQSEGDSREILKNSDAASIVEVGRAILQVGNNEVYELFQSAYSGAPYRVGSNQDYIDRRVYLMNKIGQGELLNEDLSRGPESNDTKQTELDVVVNYIKDVFDSNQHKEIVKPWLPPLDNLIKSPYIDMSRVIDTADITDENYNVNIGILDLPEMQSQEEYCLNIAEDGNICVFSAPGFGKSSLITLILLQLALQNSADNINFYILDLGNSALKPLSLLPQTADYISFDDNIKRDKLIKYLTEEIVNRKRLFSKNNSINFKMYNSRVSSEERIPLILTIIDNYEAIKELGFEYENTLGAVIRDGLGVGIHFLITAGKSNSVKTAILNNFKNRIVQYLYDRSETYGIIGRTSITLPEIKGRAIIKRKETCLIQCYFPFEESDSSIYMDRLLEMCDELKNKYSGELPDGLPMLPETLNSHDLKPSKVLNLIPVGLDCEKCKTCYIDINRNWLVIGNSKTGKTNTIKVVIEQVRLPKYVFETNGEIDSSCCDLYCGEKSVEALDSFISGLSLLINKLEEKYNSDSNGRTRKQYFESVKNGVLLIDEADVVIELAKGREKQIADLLDSLSSYGVGIIATVKNERFKGFDLLTKWFKSISSLIVLGNPADQLLVTPKKYRGVKAVNGFGLVFDSNIEDRWMFAQWIDNDK